MRRKTILAEGETYHIFSRSIANFKIFNSDEDYQRMLYLMKYFQAQKPPTKFSYFMELKQVQQFGFLNYFESIDQDQTKIVQIIAYCFMPTHIHIILKQLRPNGISDFMSNVLNSYSRYFNTKYKRKGPLWESKFKNVLVENDEQLIHLTRYLHLNPVTANLVERPEDWQYSSYKEYIDEVDFPFCQYDDLITTKSKEYRKFVLDRKSYQRELAIIKKQLVE